MRTELLIGGGVKQYPSSRDVSVLSDETPTYLSLNSIGSDESEKT